MVNGCLGPEHTLADVRPVHVTRQQEAAMSSYSGMS